MSAETLEKTAKKERLRSRQAVAKRIIEMLINKKSNE